MGIRRLLLFRPARLGMLAHAKRFAKIEIALL